MDALRKLGLPTPAIEIVKDSDNLTDTLKRLHETAPHIEQDEEERKEAEAMLRRLTDYFLRDDQSIAKVCKYIEKDVDSRSTEIVKDALRMLFAPYKETSEAECKAIATAKAVVVTLQDVTEAEIDDIHTLIVSCFDDPSNGTKAVEVFDLCKNIHMPDCRYHYKIIHDGTVKGVVQLEYIGRESMLIKNIAVKDPMLHRAIFRALQQQHPEAPFWHIRQSETDYELRRKHFWEDNHFVFYTGHIYQNYSNWFIITDYTPASEHIIEHCSMEGLIYRSVGIPQTDIYDVNMRGSRISFVDLLDSIIFDAAMDRTRFVDCNLSNVRIEHCNISGLTIDGIDVEEALKAYKKGQ